MEKILLSHLVFIVSLLNANAQDRFITKTGQAKIYSHTVAEDITAVNNTVTGVVTPAGEVSISVPVQSFQFEKSLMQEHFNSPQFMDSKQHPKISMKGNITNLAAVNLSKNGTYEALIAGELTIRGVTKPISEKALITVENGKLNVECKFIVKDISAYGVGKPKGSKKNNVADDIEITYKAVYDKS